ncbi:type II toxin-antitoxin system VapB family antitoxin [Nesterenkonia ebinurensis]|uniref:type II toxin-antitoxin system VapB family antitoxin n=1 Tax=Nesterenkonia ebinurensis TaxID=2608252 RepID=UPI00123DC874|nr:type II toxin-antitoxin system VapB family antitoxin [Nesterenkonia ebinurensis]
MTLPISHKQVKTKLFYTNRTQAVRLPKEIAYEEDDRDILAYRRGDQIVLAPMAKDWDEWFSDPRFGASEDFMADPRQPEFNEREWN